MPGHGWRVRGWVPATGHVTARGFWHPGAIDGCVKCEPEGAGGAYPQWSPSTCPRSRGGNHLINRVPGSNLPFGACVNCGYVPPTERTP
jgi:hypothetical protein